MKLILGVGINDKTYPSFITSIKQKTDEYCLWYDMLKRCYNKKYLERTKTYHGGLNFILYIFLRLPRLIIIILRSRLHFHLGFCLLRDQAIYL